MTTNNPRSGFNPKTGARPQMSRRAPFVPDAKDTSADAQTMIQQAPAPFKDRMTAAQTQASPNRNFSRDQIAGLPSNRGTQPSKQGGQATSQFSVTRDTSLSDDMLAAIGESKPSGRGVHSGISGYPTRNVKSVKGRVP